MDDPIKIDELGVSLFQETSKFLHEKPIMASGKFMMIFCESSMGMVGSNMIWVYSLDSLVFFARCWIGHMIF